MEIFGFSAAKIVTILIIAVVIFGPDKVPEMAKTVGGTIRDVRRYINAMAAEFEDATGGLREEFAGIAKDLQGELAATQADLRIQLDLTSLFAEAAPVTASPATLPPHAGANAAAPPSVGKVTESHPAVSQGSKSVGAVLPTMIAPTATGGMGGMRRPTKAVPLADFAVGPAVNTIPRTISRRREDDTGAKISPRHSVPEDVPSSARHTIGRSVAGSTYLHRRVSPAAPGNGLCRSACISQVDSAHGLTASHATAATLIAAR